MNTDNDCFEQTPPHLFRPGQSGNPAGRPKGIASGRTRALQVLDEITSREENVTLLANAMDAAFKKNPLQFFQRVMKDLIPKESLLRLATEAPVVHRWQSLLDASRENATTESELQRLRADYPGEDSRILGLLAEGIPVRALRNQMGAIRLPLSSAPADL